MKPSKKLPFQKAFRLLGAIAGFTWFTACSFESTTSEQADASTESAAETTPAAEPAADNKGVGPITSVDISGPIDEALAGEGKAIFETKCAACHKFGERYVGPDLAGVTERREPEWIMNMMLNPQEMVQQDSIAQELLAEFMTQMPNQNLTEEESRFMLEYFRSMDAQVASDQQ